MNVLARACELGVVTRREIESGLASVHVVPDAPRVRSILVRGHAIAFVKRPRSGARGGDWAWVNAERQTLCRASDAELGPRLLSPADDDLLWLSALSGRRMVRSLQRTGAEIADLADMCQGWGAAVAALHREPAPKSGRPAAWRPSLPRAARLASPQQGNADLVTQALENDRALIRAVATVDHSWSDRHWIHGDLTVNHVLIDPWPSLQVRFVGFGRAGLGDPGWDLAGCLDTIAELVNAEQPGHPATRRLRAQESMLGDYFLHAYRRSGGPGRVHPALQAVHALSMAWRAATEAPDAGSEQSRLTVLRRLGRARDFASRGDVGQMAA